MLSHSIEYEDIQRYIDDDDYIIQQKCDGDRALVHVKDNIPVALNRQGNPTERFPGSILNAFKDGFAGEWVFDGERVGDTFWIFDLPYVENFVSLSDKFETRRDVLDRVFTMWHPDSRVNLLPSAETTEHKTLLYHNIRSRGGEGVMIKSKTGLYTSGRRSSGTLKCKFTRTADCICLEVQRGGKASISLGLLDGQGNVIDVGGCSVTGRRGEGLKVGDVVEVRYLYLGNGGRLYQPVFLRRRTDKSIHECVLAQAIPSYTEILEAFE